MLVVDPVGNPMNATSLPLGEGMQSPVLDMPTGGATSAKAALLIAAFDAFKSHPMGLVGASCSPRSQPASGLQGFIAALQSRQGAAVHRRAARRLTQLTEHRQRCSWLVTGPHSRRPRAGFVCALSVWTMLALPVTPLEVCAGCVFGPVWGTLGSLCGKTVGCMLALTVGRVLGKAQGWQVRAPPQLCGAPCSTIARHSCTLGLSCILACHSRNASHSSGTWSLTSEAKIMPPRTAISAIENVSPAMKD